MSEQENVQIMSVLLTAVQQRDIQTFLNLLSDDIDFRHPMSTDIWPWAGNHHGGAQVAELFAGLAEVLELGQFEPREFIAQDDKVVVNVFERGRSKQQAEPLTTTMCIFTPCVIAKSPQ